MMSKQERFAGKSKRSAAVATLALFLGGGGVPGLAAQGVPS